jgi:hypothetical protein
MKKINPLRKFVQIRQWFVWYLIWISIMSVSGSGVGYAQTNPEMAPTVAAYTQEVAQWLQQADAHFDQQELTASYDLYLRVLTSDPGNQHAREKIYAIITTYKTLSETAQQEGKQNQMTLQSEKYRNAVRDLLQIRTIQLKRGLQQYGGLVAAEKNGKDVKEDVIPVLNMLLQILQDLKTVYAEFSRGDAGAEKMSERIGESMKRYEQELARYRH